MDAIENKLQNFKIAKYRFVFQPQDELKVARFAGTSLRKDFIPVFKQVTCVGDEDACEPCASGDTCPYFQIMESGGESEDPESKRFLTPPKPFIFEPPLDNKSFFRPSEEFALDLILVGRAIDFLPQFTDALRRLGEMGIGRSRTRLRLKNVIPFDLPNNTISGNYKWNDDAPMCGEDTAVSLSQLYCGYLEEYTKISQLSVSFVTPVRMKRLGSENWHLHFRGLMRNVLTRISNLAHRYCDYPELMDFPEIVQKSGLIRTEKEHFFVDDGLPNNHKRSDNRRDGTLGNITYRGNLTEFWGVLRLAELLHLGKNTSFGFGRIQVEPHELTSVPSEHAF